MNDQKDKWSWMMNWCYEHSLPAAKREVWKKAEKEYNKMRMEENMIFIGRNYEGFIISILSAKSKELAHAYWQGEGTQINTVECLEEDRAPLEESITGVMPILKTREKAPSIIIVKKG